MKKIYYILPLLLVIACREHKKKSIPETPVTASRPALFHYPYLSDNFSFTLEPFYDEDSTYKNVILHIYRKDDDNSIQEIPLPHAAASLFYYSGNSRSYFTGYGKDEDAAEGMYGDIVVADFNFDGREDFAVMREVGHAAFYDFYLQTTAGKFEEEKWLTKNMELFPDIDSIQQTLTTFARSGVCCYTLQVYQYLPASKSYQFVRRERRDANTDSLVNEEFPG